jgi:hypothetical protein
LPEQATVLCRIYISINCDNDYLGERTYILHIIIKNERNMKRKLIFILSLLLGTLAFTSCEKSVYDADKQPQKEKTGKGG